MCAITANMNGSLQCEKRTTAIKSVISLSMIENDIL